MAMPPQTVLRKMFDAAVASAQAGVCIPRFLPTAPKGRVAVIGAQPDGLEVFAPSGHPVRIPAAVVDGLVMPWIVRRGMYRGVRTNHPLE